MGYAIFFSLWWLFGLALFSVFPKPEQNKWEGLLKKHSWGMYWSIPLFALLLFAIPIRAFFVDWKKM